MIYWQDVPVYLHRQPVDFRKSINGLSVLVEQELKLSPFLNVLFVFCSKKRNKIKVLYWDKTGFCLWYKCLEKDRFQWPRRMQDDVVVLDKEQFEWMLRGFDIQRMRPHREQFFDKVA